MYKPNLDADYQQYLIECARRYLEPVPIELVDWDAWQHRGLSTFTDLSVKQAD
jgi:hypothetical protein